MTRGECGWCDWQRVREWKRGMCGTKPGASHFVELSTERCWEWRSRMCCVTCICILNVVVQCASCFFFIVILAISTAHGTSYTEGSRHSAQWRQREVGEAAVTNDLPATALLNPNSDFKSFSATMWNLLFVNSGYDWFWCFWRKRLRPSICRKFSKVTVKLFLSNNLILQNLSDIILLCYSTLFYFGDKRIRSVRGVLVSENISLQAACLRLDVQSQ